MIELFEGVPGSGKSYWSVKDRFLTDVDRGRRIYIYVEGIYLDRLAWFKGIPLAELEKQITVWTDPAAVLSMHGHVEPMSRVIIDEAQTIFRAMERVDKGLLRWLETHRHFGVDILMCCQDFKQMSQSVTRLVESTTKFRRLWALGFDRRCQAKVRGNPEDQDTIRPFTFTYEPKIYAYYSSYSLAAIKEEKRVHSIWKSPTVLLGLIAALFAFLVFIWHPWTSLGATSGVPQKLTPAGTTKPASQSQAAGAKAPLPAPTQTGPLQEVVREIHVLGAFICDGCPESERVWKYMLEDGEMLTASEIAGRYGIPVVEKKRGVFMYLEGPGVTHRGSSGN